MQRNRMIRWMSASIGAAVLSIAGITSGDVITADTYIDSYVGTPSPFIPGNQDYNYGGSAATKVVTSPGSTQYPNATSAVRSLIRLPDSFWTGIGSSSVNSANVTLRVRNLNGNTGIPFTRTVSAYPLEHAFTAGNGFAPTVPGGSIPNTQGGTQNTAGAPVGADWLTYDGTNAWVQPGLAAGSEYDTTNGVVGTLNTVGVTTFSWDIKSLINDPATRDSIQQYGLLLKITDDTNFPAIGEPQQFISFYSYEGALTQGNPSAFYPSVTFAVVPEPVAIGAVAGLSFVASRRFRRALQ